MYQFDNATGVITGDYTGGYTDVMFGDAPGDSVTPVAAVVTPTSGYDNVAFQNAANSNNSMDSRSKVENANVSAQWQHFGLGALNAVLGTGLNVYAQRNGVYTNPIVGNNGQQPIRPVSPNQNNQTLLPLLLAGGLIYLLVKA